MASKKYIVRTGFVVALAILAKDGSIKERRYEGGEPLELDDEQASEHLHKLEFASQKDRDAAEAAEKEAAIVKAAHQSPIDLVGALTKALAQAMASAGGQAPAPVAAA